MTPTFNAPLPNDDVPGSPPTILPLFGGAEKPVEEMTAEEFAEASKYITLKAKEAAFSRGLPVILSLNGLVVREFSDGRIESVD
jgi:hypothetical protein